MALKQIAGKRHSPPLTYQADKNRGVHQSLLDGI